MRPPVLACKLLSCGSRAEVSPSWWLKPASEESPMSKSKDTRKDTKKKPAKSLMEKRAARKEKKASKVFRI